MGKVFLYVALADNVVKIGITSNPKARLSGLRSQFYQHFGVSGAGYIALAEHSDMETCLTEERKLHVALDGLRIKSEWFILDPIILDISSKINTIQDFSRYNSTSIGPRSWTKPNHKLLIRDRQGGSGRKVKSFV